MTDFTKILDEAKELETKMKEIRQKDPFVYWSDEEWGGDDIEIPKIKENKK